MSSPSETDQLLVKRIRSGDDDAWEDLISRYEGRLLAFVESRLGRRAPSEDIVQEAFIGFLNSLPNFDGRRSLESYLFSICAYKLTDHLRREGRRPTIPLTVSNESSGEWQVAGDARPASSMMRSGERRDLEERAVAEAVCEQVQHWQEQGNWTKLCCIELLFVRGCSNKQVAGALDLSEQQVANFKHDFVSRTSSLIRKQGLSADVFPEL